jgi:hypothetical protein
VEQPAAQQPTDEEPSEEVSEQPSSVQPNAEQPDAPSAPPAGPAQGNTQEDKQADEQHDEPASGATAPDPTAEEVTNVIPRLRGENARRPIAPPRFPVPNQSQPARPAPAPRRPSPGQTPGQSFPPPRRPVPNQLPNLNPNQLPMPPIGPPRRWAAASRPLPRAGQPPVRLPIQPPGVPPVVLPSTPMVNQLIGQQPATADFTDKPVGPIKKASDQLSMSKVLAGGMAAATSAVFGSYFGTFGTVGGAAVGSVATTLATRLYQRSIEHTRDSVKAKVQIVAGRGDDSATASKIETQRTVQLDPELAEPASGRSGGRSVKILVLGTLMIFLIGLALVTGVEWAKGSPLSGGSTGTSVQRVLEPRSTPTPPPPSQDSQSDQSSSSESSSDSSDSENPLDESEKNKKKRLNDLLPSDSDSSGPSSDSNSDSTPPSSVPPSQRGVLPGLGAGSSSSNGGLFPQPTQQQDVQRDQRSDNQ